MKRLAKVVLILLILLSISTQTFAQQESAFNMRNKIFAKSNEIRALINVSKNPVFISSIWDTCTLTINQIDAYISMLGIFNTIDKRDQTKIAVNYLIDWLEDIKRTNSLSLKSLNSISVHLEPKTRAHVENLKDLFIELDQLVKKELAKATLIKNSVR